MITLISFLSNVYHFIVSYEIHLQSACPINCFHFFFIAMLVREGRVKKVL